ncbi:MAG: hypothetical protein ACOYB3_00180 [Azonexus sp.]
MTHAGHIVKILLEDAPKIRGEYWIIDGDVMFADGDIGDMNHEAYAIDHARRLILEYFGGDDADQFVEDSDLRRAVVEFFEENGTPIDPDNWYQEAEMAVKNSATEDIEGTIAALRTAVGQGDAREVAMKYWGWKWCRNENVSTWTFTPDDRRQIVRGLNDIISQEDETGDWTSLEITIGVGATGKRYSMSMEELESGRSVSRDPTWGGMGESAEDDMMSYMEPEITRLTSRRNLKVGEEVSNATFNAVDLCRHGLAKLEEIDYTGYQRFVSHNQEPIELLNRIISSHAGGADFEGEDAVSAHEAVDGLWDALTELFNNWYCPFGTHFGSHEGNGSLYGCWPSEDYLQDAVSDSEVIRQDVTYTLPDSVTPQPGGGAEHMWIVSMRGAQAMYSLETGEKLWQY